MTPSSTLASSPRSLPPGASHNSASPTGTLPTRSSPHEPSAAPVLVFSHGNSFPAGTYRQLFDRWRDAGWQVQAVERYGHGPLPPRGISSNWPELLEELLGLIDAQARGQAEAASAGGIWLVGHSLGGLLSLMAACHRPQEVRGLVMLDAPIITGWRAGVLRLGKATGMVQRVSPGRISSRRRHVWADAAAAHAHFASKRSFAAWAPGVLEDYLASGLTLHEGQVRLAFDRMIETRIYNTLPHHLGSLLRRHPLRCPLGFIAGSRSAEMRQGGDGPARAMAASRFRTIEGSHLFPMERPGETAELVLSLLTEMRTER